MNFFRQKEIRATVASVPVLAGLQGQGTKIYINEGLPPATRRLLSEARRFAASNGFAGAWVRNGAVMVRQVAGDRPMRTYCSQDLTALEGNE